MKRTILILCLGLLCGSARADIIEDMKVHSVDEGYRIFAARLLCDAVPASWTPAVEAELKAQIAAEEASSGLSKSDLEARWAKASAMAGREDAGRNCTTLALAAVRMNLVLEARSNSGAPQAKPSFGSP